MKSYHGIRNEKHELIVTSNGTPLEPRLDLWNHSPTGFECGYEGSGPAQLALALLADTLRDDRRALRLHQEFKRAVVAALPRDSWTLTEGQIRQAVAALETGPRRTEEGVL
jgi:hypothetical protein